MASLLATAVHKTEAAGGAEIEAVGNRDVLYMRSELLGDELGGKEWMKLDLARTYDSLGIDLGALGQVGQGSSEQLEATGQASGDVSDGSTTTSGFAAWNGNFPGRSSKLPASSSASWNSRRWRPPI